MKWPWKKNKPQAPLEAKITNEKGEAEGRLNIYSGTWTFVLHHCVKRIAELRERNDRTDLGLVDTAILRGQIKAMKDIIALQEPIPEFKESDTIFHDTY